MVGRLTSQKLKFLGFTPLDINTFNGKLLKAPSSRNALGRTTDYYKEDKVIHLVKEGQDYRVYDIPYTGKKFVGVIGIFTYRLTCYDDGSFQFGDGKIRQFGSVSDNTLSNDVYKAMTTLSCLEPEGTFKFL